MVLATLKRFVNTEVLKPSEQMARTLRQLKDLEESSDYREGMTTLEKRRRSHRKVRRRGALCPWGSQRPRDSLMPRAFEQAAGRVRLHQK